MKKTLSFTLGVIMILLNSCSLSENYKKLEMAEQLMEEQTDSAWHILCSIDTMQLRQGEERALYYLLLTQAQYKLYIPIKSDSQLDYSEAYYNKQGNDYYIANTNYYKVNYGLSCVINFIIEKFFSHIKTSILNITI